VELDPELLKTIAAFGGLTLDTLNFLLDLADTTYTVEAGEYFLRQDEAGDSVFILKEGAVDILRTHEGRAIHLRTLGVGDCFGEMALLAIIPRSASVRAVERCVAIKITNGQLFELYEHDLSQFTMLVMNLGREVCRRLYDTDKRLFDLSLIVDPDAGSDVFPRK
jgi:CRP-like cAMP-binding protein